MASLPLTVHHHTAPPALATDQQKSLQRPSNGVKFNGLYMLKQPALGLLCGERDIVPRFVKSSVGRNHASRSNP